VVVEFLHDAFKLNMTDPWSYIQSRQYDDAIREATRRYEEHGGNANLRNRGAAHLLKGNYEAALRDYELVIGSDERYLATTEFIMAGICEWERDRPDRAISQWRAGLNAPYRDAAGGVEIPALLVYAGCRLANAAIEKEGLSLLKKHWSKHLRRLKRRQSATQPTHDDLVHPGLLAWPGAVVPFLLGEIDVLTLQQCVEQATNETLKVRWQCAADFYMGLNAFRSGDVVTFRDRIQKCADSTLGELEHEYFLARWEVRRAFPIPAFGSAAIS